MGGIVNASRLLLFGCHSDAFALIRSAFESCSYAEYFAVNLQKVKAYLELEELISGLREAGFKVPFSHRALIRKLKLSWTLVT